MIEKKLRKIIEIDEALCNGCGLCVSPCAEGAIVIEDGKAKVVKEELCDGAGFCIGTCPQSALKIVEREAAEFSEEAVREYHKRHQVDPVTQHCKWCGAADSDRPLLPTRYQGQSVWVCVRCLPQLIHG